MIFFQGNHPNGIQEGFTKTIKRKAPVPIVGKRYYFHDGCRGFYTSIIKEILSKDEKGFTIKTLYSIYRIDY